MKKVALCLAALAMLCVCAAAAPVQRIHYIKKPLFNIPAIVKSGADFELEVETGGRLTLQGAYLEPVGTPSKRIALKLAPKGGEETLLKYAVTVPADVPEGLYDLSVQFKDNKSDYERVDYQPHAVKVIKEYKNEYNIVQITDIHFNVQDDESEDVNRLSRQLLMDISKFNPEFVIFTGDLGLEPPTYDWDYIYAYEQFLQIMRVPMYMIPGNHEMYYDKTAGHVTDGAEYWTATYGPMYHSFDYGKTHFIGMADYEGWEPKWRTRKNPDSMFFATVLNGVISDSQWKWIQADLEASHARGQECVAYMHIPLEYLQGGRKIGAPPFTAPGPDPDTFASTLTKNGCEYIFVGHNHYNQDEQFGELKERLTIGVGANTPKANGKKGFRVIHIKDGKVTGTETYEIGYEDLK